MLADVGAQLNNEHSLNNASGIDNQWSKCVANVGTAPESRPTHPSQEDDRPVSCKQRVWKSEV
jgi:hypothetical protein